MDAQTVNPFKNGNTQAFWSGVPPNYIGTDGYTITDTTTGNVYQKAAGYWVLQFAGGTGGSGGSVSTTGASGTPTANVVGTGTQGDFPIMSILLKANTLKANGTWKVILDPAVTNSASAKTIKASFNAQDCGVALSLVSQVGGHLELTFQAKSSTAITVKNSGSPNAAPVAMTVDLTVDNNLTILANLTTTGDIANVQSWSGVVSNV